CEPVNLRTLTVGAVTHAEVSGLQRLRPMGLRGDSAAQGAAHTRLALGDWDSLHGRNMSSPLPGQPDAVNLLLPSLHGNYECNYGWGSARLGLFARKSTRLSRFGRRLE